MICVEETRMGIISQTNVGTVWMVDFVLQANLLI